jgi:two-component system, NarL family, captular synthesis response regulator RcsB
VKRRVVLADDHPFVLLGVRSALASTGEIEVVGEAASPSELFRILHDVPCDVVVTDLTMPDGTEDGADGLRLVRRLRRDWPSLRIVVLTSITNVAILRAVMSAGSHAIFRKTEPIDALTCAVLGIAHGRANAGMQAQGSYGGAGGAGAVNQAAPRLSPRESEVIRQFVRGRSITEIARNFERDVSTVSRQKRDAMAKLGVSSDSALFAFVRVHGLS